MESPLVIPNLVLLPTRRSIVVQTMTMTLVLSWLFAQRSEQTGVEAFWDVLSDFVEKNEGIL